MQARANMEGVCWLLGGWREVGGAAAIELGAALFASSCDGSMWWMVVGVNGARHDGCVPAKGVRERVGCAQLVVHPHTPAVGKGVRTPIVV